MRLMKASRPLGLCLVSIFRQAVNFLSRGVDEAELAGCLRSQLTAEYISKLYLACAVFGNREAGRLVDDKNIVILIYNVDLRRCSCWCHWLSGAFGGQVLGVGLGYIEQAHKKNPVGSYLPLGGTVVPFFIPFPYS